MSLRESNDFSPVTSTKEREHVFNMISMARSRFGGQGSELTGFASDLNDPESWTRPLVFELLDRTGEVLRLRFAQGPAPGAAAELAARALSVGEIVEIFFGLDDGKYLLRAVIAKIDDKTVTFAAGGELLRLQRRNNFRISLPANSRIRFLLTVAAGQLFKQKELMAVDLSAGGFRLRWLGPDLPVLREGDEIAGFLTTGGKEMIIKAKVRAILSRNGFTEIGFEFQDIGQKDEQALVFLCLQIYRSKSGSFER